MSKFDSNIVNLNSCQCNGNKSLNDRYSLTLALNKPSDLKNEVILIMKNPSSTARANVFYNVSFNNLCDVDATTNNVIDKLYANNYTKIIILNLFPYFDSNPKTLNYIYPLPSISTNISYINNIDEIKKYLLTFSSLDVICAWGTNTTMSKKLLDHAICDILPLLSSHHVLEYQNGHFVKVQNKAKLFYPLHGKMW